MGASLCPHCGYDLAKDEPIVVGAARFDWANGLSIHGMPVRLGPTRGAIVQTLLKAGGVVSTEALVMRVGLDHLDDPGAVLRTNICKIRRLLRPFGAADCIRSHWGLGYSWNASAQTQMREAA